MKDTLVRVDDIAPINHLEAMKLAEAEYKRFTDMLGELQPGDWSKQTVNTAWNVKQLVAHVLGFAESNASFRVFAKAMRAGKSAQEACEAAVRKVNSVAAHRGVHPATVATDGATRSATPATVRE